MMIGLCTCADGEVNVVVVGVWGCDVDRPRAGAIVGQAESKESKPQPADEGVDEGGQGEELPGGERFQGCEDGF